MTDGPEKLTELGTSNETLAELSNPSAIQEFDGSKYINAPSWMGVEQSGREEVASEMPV